MLDQQDGHAAGRQLHQEIAELVALAVIEPGRGFVEQEQSGPGGQAAGQLEQPGLPGGQRVGRLLGQVRESDLRQGVVSHRRGVRTIARPTPTDLGRGEDVLADRQGAEDLEALEGAGDPEAGPLVRLDPGHVGPVEEDAPGVDGLQPGDGVEAGRLAGAVGPDEAGDHARIDGEVDAAQSVHAAESHLSFRYLEQRHRHPPNRSGSLSRGREPGFSLFLFPGQRPDLSSQK